jgi:hypothetical protein
VLAPPKFYPTPRITGVMARTRRPLSIVSLDLRLVWVGILLAGAAWFLWVASSAIPSGFPAGGFPAGYDIEYWARWALLAGLVIIAVEVWAGSHSTKVPTESVPAAVPGPGDR